MFVKKFCYGFFVVIVKIRLGSVELGDKNSTVLFAEVIKNKIEPGRFNHIAPNVPCGGL